MKCVALILISIFAVAGCASFEKGGVYFKATTAEARAQLAHRVESLRTVLRSGPTLSEEIQKNHPVRFFGRPRGEFEGLGITYAEPPDISPMVVLACPYGEQNSARVVKLRRKIEEALGPDLVSKLRVDVRFTPFS